MVPPKTQQTFCSVLVLFCCFLLCAIYQHYAYSKNYMHKFIHSKARRKGEHSKNGGGGFMYGGSNVVDDEGFDNNFQFLENKLQNFGMQGIHFSTLSTTFWYSPQKLPYSRLLFFSRGSTVLHFTFTANVCSRSQSLYFRGQCR